MFDSSAVETGAKNGVVGFNSLATPCSVTLIHFTVIFQADGENCEWADTSPHRNGWRNVSNRELAHANGMMQKLSTKREILCSIWRLLCDVCVRRCLRGKFCPGIDLVQCNSPVRRPWIEKVKAPFSLFYLAHQLRVGNTRWYSRYTLLQIHHPPDTHLAPALFCQISPVKLLSGVAFPFDSSRQLHAVVKGTFRWRSAHKIDANFAC